MSDERPASPLLVTAVALGIVTPFVFGAYAVWAHPFSLTSGQWGCLLGLNAALIITGTGLMRIMFAARQEGGAQREVLAVSAVPPAVAILACATMSFIGAHWMFVLLLGALAIQGGWDVSQFGVPAFVRRMRPIVFVTALLCLLVALVGS